MLLAGGLATELPCVQKSHEQPQGHHLLLNIRRHRVVRGKEMQQTECVVHVVLVNASALLVAGIRPIKLPAKVSE